MKIKLLKKFNKTDYPFSKLQDYGIRAIREPRYMPKELSKEINKEYIESVERKYKYRKIIILGEK